MKINNIIDLEKSFIEYFISKGFTEKKEINIVRKFSTDTTMFVIAGMIQFKSQFYSDIKDKYVNSQTCFRVSDIDRLGEDNFRLSLFKMLGLFSFNFAVNIKEILWHILEFLLSIGLDRNKISVTVHEKQKYMVKIWEEYGIKNIMINSDENIWTEGKNGLSGKCTEIFYLHKSEQIEIGNIVLIQNHQNVIDNITPHIDVGLGLERIFLIIQQKTSILQLSRFDKLHSYFVKKIPCINNQSLCILLNFFHDVLFLFNNNVSINHDKHGYLLKKMIKNMCLQLYIYNFSLKKIDIIFVFKTLIDSSSLYFPTNIISIQKLQYWKQIILQQEERFLLCILRCNKILTKMVNVRSNMIDAKVVFTLYSTYGMPKNFLKIFIEKIHHLNTDWTIVNSLIREHQNMSKTINENISVLAKKYTEFSYNVPKTDFIGYDQHVYRAQLLKKYVYDSCLILIFSKTIFFPEKGGQKEDKGQINHITVLNVIEMKDHILHIVDKQYNDNFNEEEWYDMSIDSIHRNKLESNHSAVHIIYGTLQKYFFSEDNIVQNGSFISSEQFRFDINTLNKHLTLDDIEKLRKDINLQIFKILFVLHLDKTKICIDYNKHVRIVKIGEFIEKCCGTHIHDITQLQYIFVDKIVRISKNNIRIHGYTNHKAQEMINERMEQYHQILLRLSTNHNIVLKQITKLQNYKHQQQVAYKTKWKLLRQYINEQIKHGHYDIKIDITLSNEDLILVSKVIFLKSKIRVLKINNFMMTREECDIHKNTKLLLIFSNSKSNYFIYKLK